MTTTTVKLKSGNTAYVPVMDEEFEGAIAEGGQGLCLACGAEAFGVEPDARRYECESCGAERVYGLEELVMMGLVR